MAPYQRNNQRGYNRNYDQRRTGPSNFEGDHWNFTFDPLEGLDAVLEYRPLIDSITDSSTIYASLPNIADELTRMEALLTLRKFHARRVHEIFGIEERDASDSFNRWIFEMISIPADEAHACMAGDPLARRLRCAVLPPAAAFDQAEAEACAEPLDPMIPWPEAAVYTDVLSHSLCDSIYHPHGPTKGPAATETLAELAGRVLRDTANAGERWSELRSLAMGVEGLDAPAAAQRIKEISRAGVALATEKTEKLRDEYCREFASETRRLFSFKNEKLSYTDFRPFTPLCDNSINDYQVSQNEVVSIKCENAGVTVRITSNGEVKASHTIGKETFCKLHDLYRLNTTGDVECRYLPLCVANLLIRYNSLFGPDSLGHNFHAAAPETVFSLLREHAGVRMECFASPFNCYFRRFCSAFPDTDVFFGSVGTFQSAQLLSGSFECGPPYTIGVMNACARRTETLLAAAAAAGKRLDIYVFVPDWRNPPSDYHSTWDNSQYLRAMLTVPANQHYYVTGSQFKVGGVSGPHRVWRCPHATVVYQLSTDKNAIINTKDIEYVLKNGTAPKKIERQEDKMSQMW